MFLKLEFFTDVLLHLTLVQLGLLHLPLLPQATLPPPEKPLLHLTVHDWPALALPTLKLELPTDVPLHLTRLHDGRDHLPLLLHEALPPPL